MTSTYRLKTYLASSIGVCDGTLEKSLEFADLEGLRHWILLACRLQRGVRHESVLRILLR